MNQADPEKYIPPSLCSYFFAISQSKINRRSSGNRNYTVIIIPQEDFLQQPALSLWSVIVIYNNC